MITPERIRELSAEARSNVETKANDKDDTRWWHPDHFDQEFARLIIQEVVSSQEQEFTEGWFNKTLVIVNEKHLDYEGVQTHSTTYRVDYDKFLAWKDENDFEAAYVEHIIDEAISGVSYYPTSRKYSFSDCPDWYLPILATEPTCKFSMVFNIEVEVG